MLLGPTLTLSQLEESMIDTLRDIQMKERDLSEKLTSLSKESSETNPFIYVDGERVENENYFKVKEAFEKKLEEFKENEERILFIKKKLEELENIEDASQGAIDKEKKTITLTLNDCVLLGIPEEV